MTDALREAAKQALEALELHADQYPHMVKGYTADAADALRAALSALAPAPAEAALKQARWEGIQSVQIQTAEIVRAALELLDAAGDTFPPERLAAFQRVFGAAPAAPAGWQPIETAPQTGCKIIVAYVNGNGKPRTVMARWLTDEQAAETDADDVGLEGGWYECIDNWDDYTEVAIHEGEPTHWLPIPAAPGAPQGDAAGND